MTPDRTEVMELGTSKVYKNQIKLYVPYHQIGAYVKRYGMLRSISVLS